MSLRSTLRSRLFSVLARQGLQEATRRWAEMRRKLGRRPHVVSAFLELDDPWSYLLARYLPELAASYDIELRWYPVQSEKDEAFRPEPNLLATYASEDCARLAAELGIPFLDRGASPPVEYRRALLDGIAASLGTPEFEAELLEAITCYWRGDTAAASRRVDGVSGDGSAMLANHRRRLASLGHYSPATLHYAGEWYWGIDRLHYLVARLDALGVRRRQASSSKLASIRQVMQSSMPVRPPAAARGLPPLEYFFSFRSPYSYIGLKRVFELADAFGLKLDLRPVLPMVMRGMRVPRSKAAYIIRDTSREARRLGIPFGRFRDPVGKGIERCMAVFYYALAEKRERDFVLHAGEAIWARGIDLATDRGMRSVTGRAGLFWPEVVAAMADDGWRPAVESNRETMYGLGSWGVPTLKLGDFATWGQDRIWLLARHIEELCDTGEGILV